MSLFIARNCINIRSRIIRISPLLIRGYNEHPNCNARIGSREWVAYGRNSEQQYLDHPGFPFPAVRFKEDTEEICCLREKEKGDWRNMTLDEKKELYRSSFCQTYEEIMAPTGLWKSYLGVVLFSMSLGVWLFLFHRWLSLTPLPKSFSEECQKAQLQRLLDMEMNPIHGLASKWDYQNERWK